MQVDADRVRMKILHIITRLIVGGAQENTVICCDAQKQAGHDVTLAYGPIYGPEGSLLGKAQRTGINLVEIPAMRRAILPLHDWRCYNQLRRLIRELKPDVVHTHSSKAGIVGRAAAWAENVPAVIHTIHGLPFHERQSRIVYHAYVTAERWAARRCHKLVGITQAMCDAFAEHRIGEAHQFSVIPSGVDIQAVTPAPGTRQRVREELGLTDDQPVVGIVARLDPLKGQEDLISILPLLVEKHRKLKLLLVGDGWHRPALEAMVAESGMQQHVIFAGLVSKERVMEYLAAMDINALPSYQEGQGRTLVEALAAGCAIVGYNAGGIGEVCIDNVTGKLGPVGDRQALAQNVLWLLDHPQERHQLADAGRKHVMEHFDVSIMTSRLEALYHQSLEEHRMRQVGMQKGN